jgi:hypothetical protein
MTLYVIDPDHPNQPDRRNWSLLLGTEVLPIPQLPKHIDPPGTVFVHGQFPVKDLSDFADANPDSVVIVISAGTKDQNWHDGNRRYWRKNPVRKPNDELFTDNAKRFLAKFAQTGKPDFPLLEPQDNEVLLTLRLLCEAWLLKNWPDRVAYPELQTLRTTLQVQGEKPQLPEGIDLKPPSNRDEWLTPFREVGDTTDPLPEILNRISSDKEKAVVNDFFSESEVSFAPTFENVADLFLRLNAALKASA